MAGGDAVDESKLTGLSKHFNGSTMRGRANVSALIYSCDRDLCNIMEKFLYFR